MLVVCARALNRFLIGDLSIRCWASAEHQALLWVLCVPMIFVYVLGIPFGTLYWLHRNKNAVLRILAAQAESQNEDATQQVSLSRHDQDFQSSFSFIFLGFKGIRHAMISATTS